jgi:putative DNA primase/helicase
MSEHLPRDAAAEAAEIGRLAALDRIEYDRQREAAAEALGVRIGTLDQLVKDARPRSEVADGRGVMLPMAEPWPEPVAAVDLLDDLAIAIRRHVILPPASVTCIVLWIAHTWVFDRFQHSPRLSVTSPAKRCGKSTLLDLLRATCHRPMKADNISASGVFRTVEALRPLTLLVDEADSFISDNEELRGILNSGFEAGGEVVRVVEVKDGHQPVRFATFCPVALAGIGKLPDTLEDRSVPIVLQRKAAAEVVVKLRAQGARQALHGLARRLARWSTDRRGRLSHDPAVPEAMGDREGDISIPMLSIADDAGGPWPSRARRALLDVFGHRSANEGNAEDGALLLKDLKMMFAELSALRLTSADMVARLGKMEERPWPEWRAGKPMTAPQLARALAPFGIRPATIRTGADTAKGYHREAFEEVWRRYLPPENATTAPLGDAEPSHRHNPGNSWASGDCEAVTTDGGVTGRNGGEPAKCLACDGVTAAEGWGEEEYGAVDDWMAPARREGP